MKIKKNYGMPILLAAVLSIVFGQWGCSGRRIPLDEEQLQIMRNKNLPMELKQVKESATFRNRETASREGVFKMSPLSLENAIAYALQNNLEAAVKKLETEIEEEAVAGAKLAMLPTLRADGELSERDSYAASYSDPLFTDGAQSYNYSRDKTKKDFRLELSWNLLDFGISYYQHRQAVNRAKMAELRRRRVLQNLKFNITRMFWEIQVSKAAMNMARELVVRLEEREKILQQQLEARTVSEIDVLETATALAEMKMRMSGYEKELQENKHHLATLMGLTGKVDFELADVDFDHRLKKKILDTRQLESKALAQRPELFEQDLKELVTVDDAWITVAEMAPSPSVFWRYSYDGDDHLYYDHWQDVGLKVTFDLLSIPEKMSRKRQVLKRKELVQKDRLSLAAAILTQLNISVVEYEDAVRKYNQTKDIRGKRRQLMQARINHAKLGRGHIEDVLESEAKHLFAQVGALSAYADTMIAEQRILNTIGSNETRKVVYAKTKTPGKLAQEPRAEIIPPVITATTPVPAPKSAFVVPVDNVSISEKKVPLKSTKALSMVASNNAPVPPSRPFTIHLSSWKTLEKVQKERDRYLRMGLKPYIVKVDLEERGAWWGIYVGHYKSEQEGEEEKAKHKLTEAIVKKKKFANLVGVFPSYQAMQNMALRLEKLGYFSYTTGTENGIFRLLTGAFWDRERAEKQGVKLEAEGIDAKLISR